jgi:hypothetical protein
MRKITLVCSSHRDNGLCNAQELLRLLRAIDPEVIFEEVRQSDINFYNTRSLEGQAATRFLAFKSFQRVPVDQYEMPPNFRALTDSALDFVEQTRHEYRLLQDQRDNAAQLNGFTYLNSAAFANLMSRISAIEDETINSEGNPELVRALATWRQLCKGEKKPWSTTSIGTVGRIPLIPAFFWWELRTGVASLRQSKNCPMRTQS